MFQDHNALPGDSVSTWLAQARDQVGAVVREIGPKRWQMDVFSPYASFTIDIMDQDPWITFGTEIMPDVVGNPADVAEFYREVLKYSAMLNGASLGIEHNRLIITREQPKRDTTQISFNNGLALMISAHRAVYETMLQLAQKFRLALRG